MSYILGYIVADGCINESKDRKNPFSLNITSAEKKHLYRIRKAFGSNHKISKKTGDNAISIAYQFQTRHPIICNDLINLGIFPRKTYNLNPIKVPDKYFSDFVLGFFDGDGSVYIYTVNGTLQIKSSFVSSSLSFIKDFNKRLCKMLDIPLKTIHKDPPRNIRSKIAKYNICFYINDCEKLGQFMYGNNPSLYLPRKRHIFEKWRNIKRRKYIKQNYPSKIGWYLNKNLIGQN